MTTISGLIDVLSPDSFDAEHLPGAVNLCVYETAFIEKVKEAFPDPTVELTVYGHSDATREAEVAIAKLKEAGYQRIATLPGGLEGWKSNGGKIECGAVRATANGRFPVDPGASFIHWTGRNLLNFHQGSLQLAAGHVEVKNGCPVAGEFTIDMDSLACSDLTDSVMNRVLIGHLRSGDFFEVEKHPSAIFRLASAQCIEGATAGTPNFRFAGDLTLRGVTQPIAFEASVMEKPEGGFVAQSMLEIDRTLWGSVYGSGKFFAKLGQHVVNDLVHLHLKVVTKAG